MKVQLASVYEKILSSGEVNLSGSKVNSSGMKVNLSKILILKSIVCGMCVMFSSNVSWGSSDGEKIDGNDIVLKEIKLDQLQDENLTYKVVLLGNSQVGKTQIINKKAHDKFDETYTQTMAAEYKTVAVTIKQNNSDQNINLSVWDTNGEKKFRGVTVFFLKDPNAVVIVYDITNKESFNNIQNEWLQLAKDKAPKDALYFLVGNKADLEDQRQVSKEDGQNFADDNKMQFFEVSAKDGNKINELFEAIAKNFIKKVQKESEDNKKDINMPPHSKNKCCDCCPCNKDEEE